MLTTYEILLAEREAGGTQRCRRCGREVSLRFFFMRYDGWGTVCMDCVASAEDLDLARRATQIEEKMRRGYERTVRLKWQRGCEAPADRNVKGLKVRRHQNRRRPRKPLWTQ